MSRAPTAAEQRLASLADGRVRLGPRTVHIDISNGCNTDCVTCWDHSPHLDQARPASWKRQRADAGFVARLLDDVMALGGLEAVIVSGMGEPFTHPDVYDVIADVKRRGLHLTIITNLVAADPDRLLALDVDQLLIGIHGAREASYLAFHPSFGPAHWQKLQRMLAQLRDGGRRYKHVQVICAANARDLPDMIALADRYRALQVNFKLASLRAGTEAVRLAPEDRAWLLDEGIAAAEVRARALGVRHNLGVFRAQLEAGGDATRADRRGRLLPRLRVQPHHGRRDGPLLLQHRGRRRAAGAAGRLLAPVDRQGLEPAARAARGGRLLPGLRPVREAQREREALGRVPRGARRGALARGAGAGAPAAAGARVTRLPVLGGSDAADAAEGPPAPPWPHRPTVEWQVCGACNYDCSYCIQSRAHRVGFPAPDEIDRALGFLGALPGTWEIKMTGGEPFVSKLFLERIVPGLLATPHAISVLTNLSTPRPVLERFGRLTRDRLAVVSASLHLEFTGVDEFLDRLRALRAAAAGDAQFVVNAVLVPARLAEVRAARARVEAAGFRFFPQLMKVKGGVFAYSRAEMALVDEIVGGLAAAEARRSANLAPAYTGRRCWAGARYFVLTQEGQAWSCRSARRQGEGYLGSVHDGGVTLRPGPVRCAYTICPCAVPANRGMIEGVAPRGPVAEGA